ncbi:hypothetical protein NRIC_38080 [Enterococcus florum]|uniref:Uncharacterized protein n=1 Tax=Enterococcus florum TaxID=2480627 RepID=A0A4P5PCF4_9ENTE|nr:hypothetical protein [Enterococcus florum]GCF95917.1 hypothetical protein NRIC_38080 [Enterococcus florum]
MTEYEKDFIMRQAKDLAKGLGNFLEQESIDQIIDVGQDSSIQNGQKVQLDDFAKNDLEPLEKSEKRLMEVKDS